MLTLKKKGRNTMPSLRKINKARAVDLNTFGSHATPPISLEFLCSAAYPDVLDAIRNKSKEISYNMESTTANYMDTVTGIDRDLVKTVNYDNWDKISFTESGKHWGELYEEEEFTAESIAMLWLSGEYTVVLPYSSYIYHVHNLGYNKEHDAIDYELCVYDTNYVLDVDSTFHTPLLQARIALGMGEVDGSLWPAIFIYKAATYVNYNKFTKGYVKTDSHLGAGTKTLMLKVLSAMHMLEYSWALQSPNPEFELITNLLAEFVGTVYTYNQQLKKAKTISRPVSTESTIIHEVGDKIQSVANRVRYIGDTKISVTSKDKPKVIPRDKIIHYSVGEWGRCAHYRHYKSGKVVLVKSSTVHRRCVNVADKRPSSPTGTTYVVK